MKYQAKWDLRSIPPEVIPDSLLRSWWGWRNDKRKKKFAGGRPRGMRKCQGCGRFIRAEYLAGHKCVPKAK